MDPAAAARHQKAVRLIAESRQAQPGERLRAFRSASELEAQSLQGTLAHPSRGIVAETGARGALLAGAPREAHRLVRLGLQGRPDEITKLFLLRLDALAETVRQLQHTGYAWEITEPQVSKEEDPDLFADFARRRIAFFVDEDATSIRELDSSFWILKLAIPVSPVGEDLLEYVRGWMQPRQEVFRERVLEAAPFYALAAI